MQTTFYLRPSWKSTSPSSSLPLPLGRSHLGQDHPAAPCHSHTSWSLLTLFFFGLLSFRAAPRHMEVPRLGVHLELLLPAYTTATAMRDPTRVCDLPHSSRQRQILNPLI